ncbi:MAG: hypothetical protein F6K26_24310 [Moorea sp. SIO2I5]|nr:hypothetical protein [Moorena sp. SIO2I5]
MVLLYGISVVNLVKLLKFLPNYKSNLSYSLLPAPCSLLPTPYSLLPTPYSLFPVPYINL